MAVGGLFIHSLQTGAPDSPFSSPSFSSWSEEKEGEENKSGGRLTCRLSMNNPHTAVWGIPERRLKALERIGWIA
jgi:hypothetical protein